jgi:hypothetical protein
MALRDLARDAVARLAHALAIAGLREPGAPVPPPLSTGSAPIAKPWPEPPPPRRERPGPMLDGKAARNRARREAMLIPALALLMGLSLAQAASGVDGSRLLPGEVRAGSLSLALTAPRHAGWNRAGREPTRGPGRRTNVCRSPAWPRSGARRLIAGVLASFASMLGRAIVRQHRHGVLDSRLARRGLAVARRLNRWSIALVVGGGPQGHGKGVRHG